MLADVKNFRLILGWLYDGQVRCKLSDGTTI